MKSIFPLFAMLLTLLHIRAATVLIPIVDSQGRPVQSLVTVTNILAPVLSGTNLVVPFNYRGTVNGLLTLTNLQGSDYSVEITATGSKFRFSCPQTNATFNVGDLPTNAKIYTYTNPTPIYVAGGTNILVTRSNLYWVVTSTASSAWEFDLNGKMRPKENAASDVFWSVAGNKISPQ